MDLQNIEKYFPYSHVWLWAILPSGILLIWLMRGLIHSFRNRMSKRGKFFNSEDGKRFYEYWRDGYDLENEQPVDFHMSFDDEEKAGVVAFALTRNFNILESKCEKDRARWRLTITLQIIPSSERMDEIRRELSVAANYAGGTYDGWALRG